MQRTNRRRFLAGIATTGTVLAAGCSSGGSASDGGGNGSNETSSDGSSAGNATSESGGSTSGDTATSGASGNSSASGSGETTTVAAGPDGRLVFDPESVEVSVGDTVAWEFESAGHNVSGVPKDSEEVSIPDGATPFSSYDGDPYAVVEEGKTYEHTFETAGEYTYVCIPHVSSGMIGTVTVSQ